jgi:predicted ester cyclase
MEQFKSDPGGIPEPDFGSDESNRDLAIRWFREVWNERRKETIDELWAPGAVGHTENGDQGMAEFKVGREGLLNALPDIQVDVEDTAADGDHVVVRWHARGTHRGDGLGMPPTNRKVEFRGMTWLTFRKRVIVEGWDSWNLGRLLESLR